MQNMDDDPTPERVPLMAESRNGNEAMGGHRSDGLDRLPVLVWIKHRQTGVSIPDVLNIDLLDHAHHSYDSGLYDMVMSSCFGHDTSDWESSCLTLLGGANANPDLPLKIEGMPCQIRSKWVQSKLKDKAYISLSPDRDVDMIAACTFVGSIYLAYGDSHAINLVKFDPLLRTAERSYKVVTYEFPCFFKSAQVKMRHLQGEQIHIYDSDNLGDADIVATIDNVNYPRDPILPSSQAVLDTAILQEILRVAQQQWLALRPDTPAIAAQRERQIMKNAEGEMPVDATTTHYYSV